MIINRNYRKIACWSLVTSAVISLFLGAASAQAQEETAAPATAFSLYRLADYIHWYPAIEQRTMMNKWLEENRLGTWTHTGRVGAEDRTVITPQADVNYGYCWFNISDGPMVIKLPKYERYSSLSIFDMNHFIEGVIVKPEKPIVIHLANQKSPLDDAHDVVLNTNAGLAFLRMVIPTADDEAQVMKLTKNIKTTGGVGDEPFIIPNYSDEERASAMKLIKEYALKQKTGDQFFGKSSQGVGDLDRAAGVFLGQLGIPAVNVQYTQYVALPGGKKLGGDGAYKIKVNPKGLIRDKSGYWSITVYNMADRYLIPNPQSVYSITSYNAKADEDGTYTIRINPDGKGENAIPTMKKDIYAVMRVYQPQGIVEFPPIEVDKKR